MWLQDTLESPYTWAFLDSLVEVQQRRHLFEIALPLIRLQLVCLPLKSPNGDAIQLRHWHSFDRYSRLKVVCHQNQDEKSKPKRQFLRFD